MQISTDFIDEITTRGLFCAEADRLADFCNNHYGATIDKICVGVSGGADSLALLLLANYWAEKHGISIYCVTVDHQLRQESAEEARFVKDICGTIGVFHKTIVWQRNDENIPHTKLENTAREARYNLLAKFCSQHDIPILMTAHHWNDQLETYEMRRNFNSSESGLAGMSQVRSLTNEVWLERPLLHFSKKHLQAFLKQKQINWKEDPMNTQAEFLRVN